MEGREPCRQGPHRHRPRLFSHLASGKLALPPYEHKIAWPAHQKRGPATNLQGAASNRRRAPPPLPRRTRLRASTFGLGGAEVALVRVPLWHLGNRSRFLCSRAIDDLRFPDEIYIAFLIYAPESKQHTRTKLTSAQRNGIHSHEGEFCANSGCSLHPRWSTSFWISVICPRAFSFCCRMLINLCTWANSPREQRYMRCQISESHIPVSRRQSTMRAVPSWLTAHRHGHCLRE